MYYVTATDAKQAFAKLLDAAQREPVVITKQNRDVGVLLSVEDYRRLVALNVEEFQHFRQQLSDKVAAKGLTEERLNTLLAND